MSYPVRIPDDLRRRVDISTGLEGARSIHVALERSLTVGPLLERLAGEHHKVRVVDRAALVEDDPRRVVSDGVHPSASGIQALARRVAAVVTPARHPR